LVVRRRSFANPAIGGFLIRQRPIADDQRPLFWLGR
jgi:hypothetical protein